MLIKQDVEVTLLDAKSLPTASVRSVRKVMAVVSDGKGKDSTVVLQEQEQFNGVMGNVQPGSLNVWSNSPLKFKAYRIIPSSAPRMAVPALLNGYPVFISHKYPLAPPLRKRLLIFADVHLRHRLDLLNGDVVTLEISETYLDNPTISDHVQTWRHTAKAALMLPIRVARKLFQ